MSDVMCKNCNNVVFIDDIELQGKLNEILGEIQNRTHVKVKFYAILTLLDECVDCCEKPNYWEIE